MSFGASTKFRTGAWATIFTLSPTPSLWIALIAREAFNARHHQNALSPGRVAYFRWSNHKINNGTSDRVLWATYSKDKHAHASGCGGFHSGGCFMPLLSGICWYRWRGHFDFSNSWGATLRLQPQQSEWLRSCRLRRRLDQGKGAALEMNHCSWFSRDSTIIFIKFRCIGDLRRVRAQL